MNKGGLKIFERHINAKYEYESGRFRARSCYMDIVGRNKRAIEEYINMHQGEIYKESDEYVGPFTGSGNRTTKRGSRLKRLPPFVVRGQLLRGHLGT